MARSEVRKSVYDDPPRKQVLLLTCMDLRLLDNTVRFMDGLNLQNRYDHVIFAGAAMGARRLASSANSSGPAVPWKNVFFDHLAAAINLLHREIKDIFLLEHLDCGAYNHLHPDEDVREKYGKCHDVSKLERFHRKEVLPFAEEVRAFCEEQQKKAQAQAKKAAGRLGEAGNHVAQQQLDAQRNAWKDIRVRCFLMDLLGKVKEL